MFILEFFVIVGLYFVNQRQRPQANTKTVKFGYSEKVTKLKKIGATQYLSNFKWKMFSNFVAFSEYPNFKKIHLLAGFRSK